MLFKYAKFKNPKSRTDLDIKKKISAYEVQKVKIYIEV